MDKVKYKNIDQHVTILGWLHIALNILVLFVAAFVFMILFGTGIVSGDMEAMRILTIVGVFVTGFLAVIALPGLLAGWGLLKRKSWARLLAVVLGFLNLMNFPLGTILGVYTIWALLQDGASDYFAAYPQKSELKMA